MSSIRNIAIIAHVDHGKTTLIDELLKQTASVVGHRELAERAMDSNALERERGITIYAKCTGINWGGHKINIIDTPGHADFGGEVERVLMMVDSVLLLVDAFEGPMPQTKFVLRKSLELGLQPIVVINKVDRPNARPDAVLDMVFDLFVDLEADDEALDFPVVYASGKDGWAAADLEQPRENLDPLMKSIVDNVKPPSGSDEATLQFQVATLNYDNYLGRVGIGRVFNGVLSVGDRVVVCGRGGSTSHARITNLWGFRGLERIEATKVMSGDICAVTGLEGVLPGDTITDPEYPLPLPVIDVDEPTLSMVVMVNDGPFAGLEGKFLTSRQIRERLDRELESNVALRIQDTDRPEAFLLSGRGELHLSILLEQMRREGYELQVSRPQVIFRIEHGKKLEPFEEVVIDVPEEFAGTVIRKLNERKGEMQSMHVNADASNRITYRIPARCLFGYRSEFMTDTRGTGVLYTNFDGYSPYAGEIPTRRNGALVVSEKGATTPFALNNLQQRGVMFVGPTEDVYSGQIVGEHARENDLVVNPTKKKQLSNVRSSGADDALILTPPRQMSLEQALEWISDDERVELTPESIRIRKSILDHSKRKRA
jgi:GTP-binding protein